RAIAEGARVIGYLHWSLLDNFEWAHGFGPRFGLVEVDRASRRRIAKPSAYVFSELIKTAA
ncbi:MAG: family 1 glycosylhydrolase, partial [Omnitrophica bacterium]|nr:family 1 glycosylhydrolase [Candidatus Omnitrophota bacterium]